jgi:hypothetical protein
MSFTCHCPLPTGIFLGSKRKAAICSVASLLQTAEFPGLAIVEMGCHLRECLSFASLSGAGKLLHFCAKSLAHDFSMLVGQLMPNSLMLPYQLVRCFAHLGKVYQLQNTFHSTLLDSFSKPEP